MKKSKSFLSLIALIALSIVVVVVAKMSIDKLGVKTSQDSPYKIVYKDGVEFKEVKNDEISKDIKKLVEVTNGNEVIGYVFDAIAENGYGGPINFLIGISKEGEVKGFSVISHSETQGFGAAIEEKEYIENIVGQKLGSGISLGKVNKEEGIIHSISGATVTSQAVFDEIKNIVNNLSKLSPSVAAVVSEVPYFSEKVNKLYEMYSSVTKFYELEDVEKNILNDNVTRILKAVTGEKIDYLVYMSGQGFGGKINTLLQLDEDFNVMKYVLLKHNETENFGKYIEDSSYIENVEKLKLNKSIFANSIKLRKKPNSDHDLLLISGATITSNAMKQSFDSVIKALTKLDKNNSEQFKEIDFSKISEEELKSSKESNEESNIKKSEDGLYEIKSSGFAGEVVLQIKLSKDGKIEDFKVLSHSETEGFGAEIATESYKKKFIGKNLNSDKIDYQISGATVTSDAISKALKEFKEFLKNENNSNSESKDGIKVSGFAGDIVVDVKLSKDGKIEDFKVLSHSETEGFGAEIATESYKKKFIGKNPKTDKIDYQISGATVTSDAMGKLIEEIKSKSN